VKKYPKFEALTPLIISI